MAAQDVERAKELIAEDRIPEAIELLKAHLKSESTDSLARSWLANAFYESGDYAAAEDELRILVAGPTPNARDQFTLGRALEKQGMLGEAREWIAAAAATDPDFKLARDHLKRLTAPPVAQTPPTGQQPKAPQQSQATGAGQAPLTELVVPSTEEQVEQYRRWGRENWWTKNWYGLPLPVRIVRASGVLIASVVMLGLLIFIPYVFYKLFTSDPIPPPPNLPSTPGALPGEPQPTTSDPTTGSEETSNDDTTDTSDTETDTTTDTEPMGDAEAGSAVFATAGCSGCHTLADAGSSGAIGPNLDETNPSYELALDRVTNGQGAMPSFRDELTTQQIADVAYYVFKASRAPPS